MEKIVHTYGKTWHTWHTDLNKQLPLGLPQLMMGFTAEGQADSQMISARDQRLGINTEEHMRDRSDIPSPAIDPEANGWEHGKTVQIDDPTHSAEHAAQKQQPAAPSPKCPIRSLKRIRAEPQKTKPPGSCDLGGFELRAWQ